MTTQHLTVVADRTGKVIAAGMGGTTESGYTVGISPLEGQRIHEVQVTESADAESHDEMLRGVLGRRMSEDGKSLV